ncbi:MAG TPA: ribosomal RNA small subunit methyltransferase A [Candidatus Magasanikbacteria bacterium]|nr:ribosomal RNA small subunit methyltransferase A [Candidatus Magasanikbacteria bacterium]
MYKDLFHPTHLQSLCKQYNLSPSKKYGQNYLITEAPIKKMIEAVDLKKNDTVIEIGPGFGVLTFALAERAGRVIGLEIEKKLMGYWEERIKDQKIKRSKDYGDVEIIWGNALNNLSLITYHLSPYKVIANIPYQITSDLLRTLLELENKPESITIMVQKEVAERICSHPGDMSLLAVSVQYYGEPKIIAKVPRGCFWPSPKVDSAILHLTTRPPDHPTTFSDENFFRVVKAGFANKRKQLWGNLTRGLKIEDQKIKDLLIEIVGNEKVRAEELSVEQWKRIAKELFSNEIMK